MKITEAKMRPAPVRTVNELSRGLRGWLVVGALLAAVSPSHGQSFAIDRFTIAGGGASSSGGPYSLVGTIGQSDVGMQSGGNFFLSGGFWSTLSSIPELPSLSLRRSPTNTVIISWPAPSMGFELQQNPRVATTNWSNVGISPTVVGAENQVILPSLPGSQFFRLRKP
jgi:hypothetical protein